MERETKREVPLSLQVFHSHNEYKAHRRNRTEQIHLKDLAAVLQREEKLYNKEFAFKKTAFHRHYARRFSAPLLSSAPAAAATGRRSSMARAATAPVKGARRSVTSSRNGGVEDERGGGTARPASQGATASVFSAAASLRHAVAASSPLASKMLDGLKEMSVSTRFQRIQRKLSIACMTENGKLTAKGNSMVDDIERARQFLFKKGYSGSALPGNQDGGRKSSQQKPELVTSGMSVVDEEDEDENSNEKLDTPIGTSTTVNIHKNPSITDQSSKIIEVEKENRKNDTIANPESQNSTLPTHASDNPAPNTKTSEDGPKNEEAETHEFEIDPRMKMPFIKLRANLKFRNSIKETKDAGETIDTAPTNAVEKASDNDPPDGDVNTEREMDPDDPFSLHTSSIFANVLSRSSYTSPLQGKIKTFLEEQAQFNRRFPRGEDGFVEQSERHLELVDKERKRKQKQQHEQKKKREIILEVLDTLGITDEHIRFHYEK